MMAMLWGLLACLPGADVDDQVPEPAEFVGTWWELAVGDAVPHGSPDGCEPSPRDEYELTCHWCVLFEEVDGVVDDEDGAMSGRWSMMIWGDEPEAEAWLAAPDHLQWRHTELDGLDALWMTDSYNRDVWVPTLVSDVWSEPEWLIEGYYESGDPLPLPWTVARATPCSKTPADFDTGL